MGAGKDAWLAMNNDSGKKWICGVCGYEHEGQEPPEACPVCGAVPEDFTPEEPAAATHAAPKRWVCTICGYRHEGPEANRRFRNSGLSPLEGGSRGVFF